MAIRIIQLGSRDEWLKHRMNYLGGSEASAVIGQNPYVDNVKLWQIKTGQLESEDISDKPYVQYGIAASIWVLRGLRLQR